MMRSDLMLDSGTCQVSCQKGCDSEVPKRSPYCCFKQVEINTIASGFGWMGPASGLIHRSVDHFLALFDIKQGLYQPYQFNPNPYFFVSFIFFVCHLSTFILFKRLSVIICNFKRKLIAAILSCTKSKLIAI